MMTTAMSSTFSGALSIPLIGRDDELDQIDQAATKQTSSLTVVYISGAGGIGKTKLLAYELESLKKAHAEWGVSSDLIDLYHTAHQTPEGLMTSIASGVSKSLGEGVADVFPNYSEKQDQLAQLRDAGMRPLPKVRKELEAFFLKDMNGLAEKRRLVLAIDTTEKLRPQRDLVVEELGLSDEDDVFTWMLNTFLPVLKNSIVLLAGRTEDRADLTEDLTNMCQEHGGELVSIPLHGLSEDDTLTYFKNVIEQLNKSDKNEDRQAGASLKGLSRNDQLSVRLQRRDGLLSVNCQKMALWPTRPLSYPERRSGLRRREFLRSRKIIYLGIRL